MTIQNTTCRHIIGTMPSVLHQIRPMAGVHENKTGTISSVPSTMTSVPLEFGTMTSAPHKIRPMTGVHENQTGTISSVLGKKSSVPTKIGYNN